MYAQMLLFITINFDLKKFLFLKMFHYLLIKNNSSGCSFKLKRKFNRVKKIYKTLPFFFHFLTIYI